MIRNEDIKTNDRGFGVNGNPFLWLFPLDKFLHTLCQASSYMVDDPEDARPSDIKAAAPKVLNIERGYIEEHIASCRNFIVEWTIKKTTAHPIALCLHRSYA